MAMEMASVNAGNALIGAHKTVAVIQAFLILAVYAVPKRKLGEDKTILFASLAIRCGARLCAAIPN